MIENEIEEQIDNQLTGKAKCINDLLTEKGTDFVKTLLENFKGNSEFDIKIVSQDRIFSLKTGDEINGNGETWPPLNKIININISTSKTIQHAALEGTKTILHEYIHADIYRKLNTKYASTDPLDFKKTYTAYEDQHEAIGALYVSSMRNALKHFIRMFLRKTIINIQLIMKKYQMTIFMRLWHGEG